ncbi:MAG TPA: hypothetical protein PK614_07985, partial [Nitrospira sp.]|nr:hypothetical protein [Nitrospira sp.]
MHRNVISRSLLWQWTAFFICLCLALPSWADEVHLQNGDRLTGTILKMEERVLTLQTDYGGEVKIDWGKVESLKSDGTLKILVPGESHDALRDFLYGAQALRETRELGPESPVPLA